MVEHSCLVAKSLGSLVDRQSWDLAGHTAEHEYVDFAAELEVSIPCHCLAGSMACACHKELAVLPDLGPV